MECPSGVPTGSVLGPLLFLIFINDLSQQVSSELLLFTDDVKLGKEICNQENIQAPQEDLTRLQRMKKILARLAQGDSDEGFASYNNLGNHQGPHLAAVGRNFRVGSFTLVVESVIAEAHCTTTLLDPTVVVAQNCITRLLRHSCRGFGKYWTSIHWFGNLEPQQPSFHSLMGSLTLKTKYADLSLVTDFFICQNELTVSGFKISVPIVTCVHS
ncbi:unnamed protein product [Schistosoma curassoni]|uniref:Reverse transcriptase domain-containing protein n=1 Tax=Schistosoma curassoni TaxID=6186 RepID=A0A183JGW4_9TREM|nr:unnamed protein product [Schistosoma curassoni]